MTDTSDMKKSIVWTLTDEAPALATRSFLPIVEAFSKSCNVEVELRDISLAGRILANFPDYLDADQKCADALSELGALTQFPNANIIKLPNISASVPQLKACIAELQSKGYRVPNYPEDPQNDDERALQKRFKKCLGSAVNPVLREGNSDRRAPPAVKEYARNNPHRLKAWDSKSQCTVAHMSADDFFQNEKSVCVPDATTVQIVHTDASGNKKVLKEVALEANEIMDSTFMSKQALVDYFEAEMQDCKEKDILFSLHMKATMMKVSDPIIFGHCVKVYFKNVFEKHGALLEKVGVNVNNGFGDLLQKIENLPADEKKLVEDEIAEAYKTRPGLAMVNSDNGITNLHVPSDVIIDASMPVLIRDAGQMWNADGKLQTAKACIPDRSYATMYNAVVDHCKQNGAFDVKTMGTCPNVGLMAKKAEEYGSHDKTFQVSSDGTMAVVDKDGKTLMEHNVQEGDIWRACQVKDGPVRDWVSLAVRRARDSNTPAVFWLDSKRAHDANLITKVNEYLKDEDTNGLELSIKPPAEAATYSCGLLKEGKDCISVTGNVLRDYNTDLFPIIEVGTSAKMLSIVPLMKGGGLFETGAGGSAPKHVDQFNQEGHLRWDSLGEFLALAVSLEHLATVFNLPRARLLGKTLDQATTKYLLEAKSPSRKVNERDNRGTHFWVALFWAQALAGQTEDANTAALFTDLAKSLADNEGKITSELLAAQGAPVDIDGYYLPDESKVRAAMRPSATFNNIIDSFTSQINSSL